MTREEVIDRLNEILTEPSATETECKVCLVFLKQWGGYNKFKKGRIALAKILKIVRGKGE